MVMQIWLPLMVNLAWGLLALVGIPRFLGVPLSIMQYLVPAFGYTLLISGVVALGWALVRTVLAYLALRRTDALHGYKYRSLDGHSAA
jgi:hypothetical protein